MVSNLCPKEQGVAACREEREQGCAFRSHSMGAVRSLPLKPLHHTMIYQALFVLGGVTDGKRRGPSPTVLTPWQQDHQSPVELEVP